MVPGDPDAIRDAYVRDMQIGVTELISISSAGAHAAGASFATSISADGRYAVFTSIAGNLVPGDTGSDTDIHVRDRVAGTTVIVSVDSAGVHGNGNSEVGVISPDGRYVAFRS